MKNKVKAEESWVKEFMEKFSPNQSGNPFSRLGMARMAYAEEYIAFIHDLLSRHDRELRKRVEGMKKETIGNPIWTQHPSDTAYNDALDSVLALLDGEEPKA